MATPSKNDPRNQPVQRFSSEDIQQILALAMRQTEFSSREQLEEIAQELSIEPTALESALKSWQAQKLSDKKQQYRRQQFYRYELLPYLVVNAFLICLNISISGAITWAIYPLMGWGVGLLISGLSGFPTGLLIKGATGYESLRGCAQRDRLSMGHSIGEPVEIRK